MARKRGPDSPLLSRRTNALDESLHRPLPENSFWQQVQGFFIARVLDERYDPDLYVPVHLGPNFTLLDELRAFVEAPQAERCLFLVGQYGVGKTSALAHYRHLTDPDQPAPSFPRVNWIYFNGDMCAAQLTSNHDILPNCVEEVAAKSLGRFLDSYQLTTNDFYDHVLTKEDGLAPYRLLHPTAPAEEGRIATKRFLERSPATFIECILRYMVARRSQTLTILVLDNLDPLPSPVQLAAATLAISISKACNLPSIVAVRTRTEEKLRYSNEHMFGHFVRTLVPSPPISDVLKRRVERCLQRTEFQDAKLGEGAIRFPLRECPEFADILVRGLSGDSIRTLLDGLANGSVREGLRMSLSVYASPYIDASRIIRKLSPAEAVAPSLWSGYFPHYMVVRSLVLRNQRVYDAKTSWVGNLYGTPYAQGHAGPFLRLLILRALRSLPQAEKGRSELEEMLSRVLRLEPAFIAPEIKWLAEREWLTESPRRTLRLARRGRYVCDTLMHDQEYLTLITPDVDMHASYESRLVSAPQNQSQQISNLSVLIEYLARREEFMLYQLSKDGLNEYCALFGTRGIVRESLDRLWAALPPEGSERGTSFQERTRRALAVLVKLPQLRNIVEVFARFG